MRKSFPHYLPPAPDHFWIDGNATIVLDSNALLNLYRFEEEASKAFRGVLTELKIRLWIPHQVGREFFKNRIEAITERQKTYSEVRDKISSHLGDGKFQTALGQIRNKNRYPFPNQQPIEAFEKSGEALLAELDAEVKRLDAIWHDQDKDDILKFVLDTYEDKIGKPFSSDVEVEKEGEWKKRKTANIPPGYKDDRPGDYLIWCQTIEYAREVQKPVLFITGDQKPDWWDKWRGRNMPKPALLQEFFERTNGHFIHFYSPDGFLTRANEHIKTPVKQEIVESVKEAVVAQHAEFHKAFGEILGDFMLDPEQGLLHTGEAHAYATIYRSPITECLHLKISGQRQRDIAEYVKLEYRISSKRAIEEMAMNTERREPIFAINYLKSLAETEGWTLSAI